MRRFGLYVDDSGTKEYAGPGEEYGRSGKSRYFVYGGLLLEDTVSSVLASDIAGAKRAAFGTADVELKSNWLRMPKERTSRYLNRFGISEDRLRELVEQVYSIIGAADVRIFAAVVDKPQMQDRYGVNAYQPSAMAYECLMQRVALEIRPPNRVAVTVDDMTGKTPKGNEYKRNLDLQHTGLVKSGSRLQKAVKFDAVEPRLRFMNSADSHLLQVADIVAYNVYRQFFDHGEQWEDATRKELDTYPWFARIGAKFCSGPNGRVQGYGVVKAPTTTRVPWAYRDD